MSCREELLPAAFDMIPQAEWWKEKHVYMHISGEATAGMDDFNKSLIYCLFFVTGSHRCNLRLVPFLSRCCPLLVEALNRLGLVGLL